ncbi:MAG: bacterioferritin [Vicinamibacterales bacterium]
MQGNVDMIARLNDLLAEELTAINQYMVHGEMCDNWGYHKLHEAIEKQAIDEMHHAEWLIGRIIFLEGSPTVSRLNEVHIGRSVEQIVTNDRNAEAAAVDMYNSAIALAREVNDDGTRDLLTKILADEEKHLDWGDAQHDQISQMGIANYLANQV